MIYELNEMIDYLDQFFESSHRVAVVGGIAGTQIEKFVLDAALKTTPFSKILVLNGCQDYIGLMKNRLDNVLYYADILVSKMVDSFLPIDPWKPKVFQPETEYVEIIDLQRISQYDIILVFNTQLLPPNFASSLSSSFCGKIVYVCDPLETYYCFTETNSNCLYNKGFDMPTIVDCLEKLSPILAMARSVFGFDTRSIDRKIGGSITEIPKINKKSVGKIDDCQYMTNDYDLLSEIRNKQKETPFRKNQKVIVNTTHRHMLFRTTSLTGESVTIADNSMLVVTNPNSRPLMQLRLYNSKSVCGVDVCYENKLPIVLRPQGNLTVNPANIIAVNQDMMYHRYNKTVLILDYPLNAETKYSVLKNSNNVIVVNNIKKQSIGGTECSDTDFEY